MSRWFLSFVVVCGSYLWAGSLSVEVDDIEGRDGSIYIGVFDKKSSFGKISEIYRGESIYIESNRVRYTFRDIPNGVYAISLFHDQNSNGKLDKNFFGMPTEGYGFSHNIHPKFRGAKFDEAKFELKDNISINIKMRY
jgi:uncharacterized protein (DUF2141 family)